LRQERRLEVSPVRHWLRMTILTIMTDHIIITTDATITADIIVMDTIIIMDTVTMVVTTTITDTGTTTDDVTAHIRGATATTEMQMNTDAIMVEPRPHITMEEVVQEHTTAVMTDTERMEHEAGDIRRDVRVPGMAALDTMAEAEARHGQHTEAQLL